MKLSKNQTLDSKQLAEFFNFIPKSFSQYKNKKLEELKDYADFDINYTEKGNFKSVLIKEVYCPLYIKSYKQTIKTNFLKWLDENNPIDLTSEAGYSNCSIITNYYCAINNIPYDGLHYIEQNSDKMPNPEFYIWHYLHHYAYKLKK